MLLQQTLSILIPYIYSDGLLLITDYHQPPNPINSIETKSRLKTRSDGLYNS